MRQQIKDKRSLPAAPANPGIYIAELGSLKLVSINAFKLITLLLYKYIRKLYKMLRWVPFAAAAIFALTTLGGAREDRSLFNTCHLYPIVKTFTVRRIANNDSCIIQIPSFQCGGYCETETLFMKSHEENGMYELRPKSNGCKCCEGVNVTKVTLAPNTFDCRGSKNLKYDREVELQSIGGCTCLRCRSSNQLPAEEVSE